MPRGPRCLVVDGVREKRSQNPAVRTFSSSCGPGDRGYDADLEILGRLLQTHLCVGVVYYIQYVTAKWKPSKWKPS